MATEIETITGVEIIMAIMITIISKIILEINKEVKIEAEEGGEEEVISTEILDKKKKKNTEILLQILIK